MSNARGRGGRQGGGRQDGGRDAQQTGHSSDLSGGLPSLRYYRIEQMLSQAELAQRSGMTVITVKRLEAGQSVVRASTARALATALGVEIAQLRAVPPAAYEVHAALQPLEIDVGGGTVAEAEQRGRESVQPPAASVPGGATVSDAAMDAMRAYIEPEAYMSAGEAAHALHLSSRWIGKLADRGEFEGVVRTAVGRLIPRASVAAYAAKKQEQAQQREQHKEE